MRDASWRDQLCVYTGFLKFRNSRLHWRKRYDLIVVRMNRQNRNPPSGSGYARRRSWPTSPGDDRKIRRRGTMGETITEWCVNTSLRQPSGYYRLASVARSAERAIPVRKTCPP
jgi:hypothetical protein